MENTAVLMRQGDTLTVDGEFDLVIGDLERDVPEHRETRMQSFALTSSCQRIYCCF